VIRESASSVDVGKFRNSQSIFAPTPAYNSGEHAAFLSDVQWRETDTGFSMQFVEANGARIPAIGLGTWELRGRTCARLVEQALRLGYGHIDTAEVYENEREVGEGLRASGVPRPELFVTTKVWT
jgi:hypothetical protein